MNCMKLSTRSAEILLAATSFVVCPVLQGAFAQVQDNLELSPINPSRRLHITAEIPLGVPGFAFTGEPVCDSNGEIFVELLNPARPVFGTGPFLVINPLRGSHTLINVPDKGMGSGIPSLTIQAVSPSGNYYLLGSDYKKYNLSGFQLDGSVRWEHKVDLPAGLIPETLSVTDSGTFLIEGELRQGDKSNTKADVYLALFDESGRLIRRLSGERSDTVDLTSFATAPREAYLTTGDDGRFYKLSGSTISVLKANGTIERVIHFKKPNPSELAVRLDVSNGLVSIKLADVPKEGGIAPIRFLILDLQTGEPRAVYEPDDNVSNTMLCFNRTSGYTMYSVKDGRAILQTVSIQ